MTFKVYDETTKAMTVFIIMPKKIMVVEPKSDKKTKRKLEAINSTELIPFQSSLSLSMLTLKYKLPEKGIALEEYTDYFVVNVGIKCNEIDFGKIIEIATQKEKGLILKPPKNPSHLYLLDKIIINHNDLYQYESVRY